MKYPQVPGLIPNKKITVGERDLISVTQNAVLTVIIIASSEVRTRAVCHRKDSEYQ